MTRPDNILDMMAVYDKLINAVNSNIKSLKIYPKLLSGEADKDHCIILDKCLYIALVQNDLLVSLKYLDVSNNVGNSYEANYFARAVGLHLYEVLNHLNKSIGADVRSILSNSTHEHFLENINQVGKSLNELKKVHFRKLEILRNNVMGHKSHDGIAQTEIMLSMNNKELYDLGVQIYKANFKLVKLYMQFLQME
ncbi:MAG: hypothetical protein JWO92_1215 [Chitinophagaceae bacterium]|nr:hypothetical protein [Chitinophagaceae bacterium]